ncbi:MAG: SLC13 family permease, partial [Pseudomonadota bacterium]|nr:SLC13 family permease [Pseudomonadota bacterium]
VILSAFFLLCAVVTNILSNNATAVLFTPLAVNLAGSLNVDPLAFILAVLFAANCSFATPIAYQTNLLVMTPGNYQFRDFLRAGTPLIILVWLTYSIIAPWYFGF